MSAQVIAFPAGLRLESIKARVALGRSMPSIAALAASAERRAYITGFMDAHMRLALETPAPARRKASPKA